MKIIYESSYMISKFDSSNKLMEIVWQSATKYMLGAQFQSEILSFFQLQNQYKSEKILIDERLFAFKAPVSIQQWMLGILDNKSDYHAKKIAIVVSEDIFHRAVSKKMAQKVEMQNVSTIFYTDKEKAKTQLLDEKKNHCLTDYTTIVSSILLYK
ncbi:hypothetical protein [Chondrinema litorale]|uniref:hypothetical protein n=1 Tax=Chondrinema litorale TaxID=2994555 RepID=UPI002542A8B1|nr:hypothetical protein [Chondrinema litorale]UZR98497.1 hypothetical protein OQ292_31305 [Chondrinema litorale]